MNPGLVGKIIDKLLVQTLTDAVFPSTCNPASPRQQPPGGAAVEPLRNRSAGGRGQPQPGDAPRALRGSGGAELHRGGAPEELNGAETRRGSGTRRQRCCRPEKHEVVVREAHRCLETSDAAGTAHETSRNWCDSATSPATLCPCKAGEPCPSPALTAQSSTQNLLDAPATAPPAPAAGPLLPP